jgi:DNA-binding Xre family transcriptional regulator
MIEKGNDLSWLCSLPKTADDLAYDHKMDISASVYKRMKELGLTQSELAERMGADRSQISRILAGSMNITLRTIARLEEALNFRLDAGFTYVNSRQLQVVPFHPSAWNTRMPHSNSWSVNRAQISTQIHPTTNEVAA